MSEFSSTSTAPKRRRLGVVATTHPILTTYRPKHCAGLSALAQECLHDHFGDYGGVTYADASLRKPGA